MEARVVALKLGELGSEDASKRIVDLAGVFECVRIDEQGSGPGQWTAGLPVVVGEKIVTSLDDGGRRGGVLVGGLFVAGDELEDLFGNRRVVTDHDEDGRRGFKGELAAATEVFVVMLVELIECGLKRWRDLRRGFTQRRALLDGPGALGALSCAGKLVFDVSVEISKNGFADFVSVVASGKIGNLNEPGFNGLSQTEVGDGPRKKTVRLVAGAGEKIRRGAEIINGADLETPGDLPESGEPHGGAFVFLLGVLAFGLDFLVVGFGEIAMMGLIVEYEQARARFEAGEDAFKDLGVVFGAILILGAVGLDFPVKRRALVALQGSWLEPLEIGNREVCVETSEAMSLRVRDEGAFRVVVADCGNIVVGFDPQHAEAIANRDAGCDEEKIVGEARIAAIFLAVAEMVNDERAHHDGLAGAGGHLEGDAWEIVGRVAVDSLSACEFTERVLSRIRFFGDFVEPDGGFDRLALGKEKMIFASRIEKPIVKQFLGDAGGVGIGVITPELHFAPEKIDEVSAVVASGLFNCRRQIELWAGLNGYRLDFR